MKKFLKILLIIILFLLAVLFVTPILFKGKIMEIAKEQINKNVNAKVEFDDLGLSFIKNFPYASIALKKLSVAGVDKFEDDTLLKLNSFNVKVDIISAIKMENIKVKGIVLDRPEINAIKLEDGSVNWDIMKETEEKEEEVVDTAVSEFTATIALKKFEIKDAGISYTDDSSNMAASLDNFDFLLKGDLSQDFTTLSIISSTEFDSSDQVKDMPSSDQSISDSVLESVVTVFICKCRSLPNPSIPICPAMFMIVLKSQSASPISFQ